MHPTVHTSIFKCIKVHVHAAFVYHSPHYYENRCRYVKFGASSVLCVVCTNAPEKTGLSPRAPVKPSYHERSELYGEGAVWSHFLRIGDTVAISDELCYNTIEYYRKGRA